MSKTTYCTHWQSVVLKRLQLTSGCTISIISVNDKTARPTVEAAAKFLREDLGADLVVSPRFSYRTGNRIGYFWRWSQRTDVIDHKVYATFEKALLAGISKVLEPFKEYYSDYLSEKGGE